MPNFSVPFLAKDEQSRLGVSIYREGQRAVELDESWCGVATGDKANSFWYVGKSYGERSFTRLSARNFQAAVAESAPIAFNERLEGQRSSFNSFTNAIYEHFDGDPKVAIQLLQDVKVVEAFDAIRMFSAPSELSVDQQEKLHLIQGLQRQVGDPHLGVDALLNLGQKKSELEDKLIRSFVDCKTLVGLETTGSNRNRYLLSQCPEHKGQWRVTTFTPDGEPWGHSNYQSKAEAIQQLLQSGNYAKADLAVRTAPFRETDYAFVNGEETYLIVDRVQAGHELGALLQTVAVSQHQSLIGVDVKNGLVNTVNDWSLCPVDSTEFKVYNDALHRTLMSPDVQASKVDLMFAFAVEAAVSHGVKPSFHSEPASAANWLAEVKAVVENFYDSAAGLTHADIEAQDLVNFAFIMAHLQVPEVGVQIQQIIQEARDDAMQRALGSDIQPFGYFVNLNERGSFYADVRNAAGSTLFEVRGGNELAEDETSLVEDGYMSSLTDVDGLRDYLVDHGVLPKDASLYNSSYFEKVVEQQAAAKDRLTAPAFDMR